MAKTRAGPVRAGTAADLVLGSWRRTLIVAAALLAVFVAVVVGALNFTNLQHTSFPGHPYPPAGYYRNPFPGSDELVNSADAAKVKAEFIRDGQIELQAFAAGDGAKLPQADTGNSLTQLRQLLDQFTAQGIVRSYQNRIDKISVGHLADPAAPGVMWCIEEQGQTTAVDTAKSTGHQVATRTYRFAGRFWLAKVGDRYLITDAEVTNQ